MIELELLKQKRAELEIMQQAAFAALEPLQRRLIAINEELRPLRERIAVLEIEQSGINWPRAIKDLADDSRSSIALIRRVDAELHDNFSMKHNGYWSDTLDASFSLMVRRGDPDSKRKCLEGLRKFTPLFTPHTDGYVWFKVFEHTLASEGGYTVCVKPDLSGLVLKKYVYGLEHTVEKFPTPELLIDYIAEAHYYEDVTQSRGDP